MPSSSSSRRRDAKSKTVAPASKPDAYKPTVPPETAGEPQRRCRGLQPMAGMVPTLAQKALGHKGVALGGLLADWASIAGARLADRTTPVKLSFPRGERTGGQLHIRVMGAVALDVQHAEPQILDRINAYFGYRAVARLKLIQGPVSRGCKPQPPPRRPLGAAEESALRDQISGIEDPGLSDALLGYGRAMAARRPR